MYTADFHGVKYFEGTPENVRFIKDFNSEINEWFGQSQLKNLNDIKLKINVEVNSNQGNCVYDFKYGQKSTFWKGLLGWDDVHWHASGKIGYINNG
jgi:hypothetical protein